MNSVILRKSGGFYLCFDNDAIIISYFFNYKIVNGRVGFPVSVINRVINVLEDNFINYSIRESSDNVINKSFGKRNKYKFYLDKGNNKICLNNRVDSIIKRISNLEYDKVCYILDLIEDNI